MTNTNNMSDEEIVPAFEGFYADEIRRPTLDSLTEGIFNADINDASPVNTTKGKMVKVSATFRNGEGDELDDSLLVPIDWKPVSPFRKLLELADCLPERGERLDLDGLVGLTFLFTLKINEKNGKEYVNLVDVALPDDEE